MFSKVYSAGIRGVEGYLVDVEVDVSDGLPAFVMVGFLAAEVREAQDRVRTALRNSGFYLPARKVTVNLSPADVRKEGTAFDLAVGVAVLCSFGIVKPDGARDAAFIGELGLDGEVKPVKGVLSRVEAMAKKGIRRCFLPTKNVLEGTVIKGIEIVGVSDVAELAGLLASPHKIKGRYFDRAQFTMDEFNQYSVDFSQVNGQALLRRATEIAVAGMHNILYIGPAGTGKTMVAKRIPTIMPSISLEESIEISKIYSICGLLPENSPLVKKRPFRSPHHSITAQALIGGGSAPKPGEISLASHGALFLDELPEYRGTLDLLRQPLEEKRITVARLNGSCEFPADCVVAAAMNPCKCGFYPDRSRCTCSESQVRRYLNKVSRPLLDRFDICVESSPMPFSALRTTQANENSETIRSRVEAARKIQARRRGRREGTSIFNSGMSAEDIRRSCSLNPQDEAYMEEVYNRLNLSARAYLRILKVARTIADLDGCEDIKRRHLSEAAGYCSFKEKYWGRAGGDKA